MTSPYVDRAAASTRTEAEAMGERCQVGQHDWQQKGTGGWGIVIGVSKCNRCGYLARTSDFPSGWHEEV